MQIAVNTRFLIRGKMEGIGWYTHELMSRMVQAHPEVHFHFFFDRAYDASFIYANNVTGYALAPMARHGILWYLWFEFSVARALRRTQADVFFSPDNFMSLRSSVPTVMTCHDLIPFHYPEGIPGWAKRYYHRFWPKYLKKATQVIAVSETTRRDLLAMFQLPPARVTTVFNGSNGEGYRLRQISPTPSAHNIAALTQPYFISVGSIHPRKNTIKLVQAFNAFKQKTGLKHQLALVGRVTWNQSAIEAEIEASPYRSDIISTGYVTDTQMQTLISGAEAMLYISLFEGFGLPILEAMQQSVPVITSDCSAMPEVAGDAAILVTPTNIDAIAWAMHRVITDTALRKRLVSNGLQRVKLFDWDQAAEAVFQILQATAAQNPRK
jgi:glycosyltransferase involved in cell wall biosynthesis